MSTYPLPTLAPVITQAGISAPSYSDILLSLTASYQAIYGADAYLAADSQDGQWLAILALAIHDSNQAAIMVFNSFSPTYSQGAQLASLVKLNGLVKESSSHSTAVGNVVGQAGTTILNGVVKDINGSSWSLPSPVVIPIGGSIAVTVTSQVPGAISAAIGDISQIATPQLGWQTFSNTVAAVAGAPVESDATLRARQSKSTSLPAQTILDSIAGAIANVSGVTRSKIYENDTSSTDANGVPSHSICAVVLGGSVSDIGNAIFKRKSPGVQTYGSQPVTVYDSKGLSATINYSPLTLVPIYFAVTIKALPGYVSSTGTALQSALSAFVNSLDIGEDVYASQSAAVASLIGQTIGQTFYITSFQLGTTPAPVGTGNLAIAFNAAASSITSNIVLTVT